MRWTLALAVATTCALGGALWACGGDDSTSGAAGDDDSGTGDDGGPMFPDGGSGDGPSGLPCDEACPQGLVCNHGTCEPPQKGCVSNADCQYDTYCDASGQCVPFGSPPDDKTNDPNCKLSIPAGALSPKTFCEFSKAPANDPFPNHVDVQSTPIVVRFGLKEPPSIAAAFTAPVSGGYSETLGIVRVLSGADCSLSANLGGVDLDGDGTVDWVNSSTSLAVGDLDHDGIAEIVAFMGDRTTVAFTRKNGVWGTLWPKAKATLANGTTLFVSMADGVYGVAPGSSTNDVWSGPSIHDLDDDGVPEIVREGYVIDGATGKLRANLPAQYASYSVGMPPVLANLDADPAIELTNGAHIWEFDGKNNAWTLETSYETATTAPGWTAVADFNPYDNKAQPEIAVATASTLTVYALDHSVFMGTTVAVPGGGGGPPTIADYDGDGLPEVGLAGADYYTVFDPDCQTTPRQGGKCVDRKHCDFASGGNCPNFVLWSRKSQDHSSNITGSSVFDFEADGTAEVVYADECFARVYSGTDGTVLFSQYHSSCTWLENPVVADVDGDYRAELVVPSNTACGAPGVGMACSEVDSNGVDVTYPGQICQNNGDCVSGVCDSGYCRCQSGADCCNAKNTQQCLEAGYACVPPPQGTPGTGNTCRAAHPHGVQGIRVYKDAKDRWVRSRTIWNQHAYAVTHVNEDGTIPKTSAWANNWTSKTLDNFRQNVPGTADGKDIPDITAQAGPFYTCSSGQAVMTVPICNRGTAPAGSGIPVGFYVGQQKVCSTQTTAPIDIAQCQNVTCTWTTPPTAKASAVDVTVVANDGNAIQTCTQNNIGLVEQVYCAPAQ